MRSTIVALTVAVAGSTVTYGAPANQQSVHPNIAETSHASKQAIDLFRQYFTGKSTGNNRQFDNTWNPKQAAYYDSTIGLTIVANRSQLEQLFPPNTTTPPGGSSYPLRIIGDTVSGAVVYFVDTPELFGAEIRSLASFDFVSGTIIRQLDNWDGRDNSFKATSKGDVPYPDFGLPKLQEKAADPIKKISAQLNNAFAAGDASAAAALFSYDAVYEDLPLRTRIEGQIAISSYLKRAISSLPYGPGTKVTHVVGSKQGGGYEWRPTKGNVLYGLNALELDNSGNITRFIAAWDGSRLDQAGIQALAKLAPEP